MESSPPTPPARPKAAKSPPPSRRIIALEKKHGASASRRKWTVAQKEEMNRFLDDLAAPAKTPRNPSRQAPAETREAVERIPNSPDPHPMSLEMYFEGMLKRLNRSAAYVKADERQAGSRAAAVLIRVNPNGSLNQFGVLNSGDQHSQIAYVKAIVERSVPFQPFPPDIARSVQTLSLVICIQPGSGEASGATFSRLSSARNC